jgi:hypothetical protein
LHVEPVLLNGSGRTSQALSSGSLFAASVALPRVMLADLNGADLVNVAHGIGVQASRLVMRPEIRAHKAEEFVDTSFVAELEKTGFIKKLYEK